MDVNHINPFIRATSLVFDRILGCSIERESVFVKQTMAPSHELSGVIGLSGKACGSVVFSLSRPVAFALVERMLERPVSVVDDEVVDAIGELTNIIAGAAKAELSQYELSVGLPNVVVGRHHTIRFPGNVRPLCIAFWTPWGPMSVEVGLDCRGSACQESQVTEVAQAR